MGKKETLFLSEARKSENLHELIVWPERAAVEMKCKLSFLPIVPSSECDKTTVSHTRFR